nr:prostatic acid phosphatase-like [Onthophagus taurus]
MMKKIDVLIQVLVIILVGGEVICENELVSVVIIFRHGARTIIQPYPTDPYKNESLWPVGFGQLTNEGKMQHFKLGQYFRERYGDFLPKKYTEKQVYVRSTDVDRTLMSAAANLAGLFPPEGAQVWDKDIPWQPIPIHTEPELEDAFLASKKPCAKYDILYNNMINSEEMKKLNFENKDLYEYLNKHSGENIKDFDAMGYLYNNLFIENYMNFTLPEWTKEVFPDKMKPLSDFSFALPCYKRELARFKTGPFFYDLLKYFSKVKHRKNVTDDYIKLKIFSGHDTTLANLLESLGIFEYHSPPFRSTLIFELYQNKSSDSDLNHFVKIFYKNTTSEPNKMVLKGCDFDCDFEIFQKLLEPLSMSLYEWDRECKVSLFSTVTENRENLVIATSLLIIVICFVAVLIKFIYIKNKKDRTVYLRLPDDEEQV